VISCWNISGKAKLVVEEIPYVKSAAIGVYIKVGSRHESEGMAGVSHFIEHMLFKGTDKRSAREIAESFERIGGQVNAFTSKEYTGVYARTLDESIYEAMDIIFDMIFCSAFKPKDFNTEKGVVIEEINMYEDTPDDLIHDVFAQHMWQGNSMASPILGTLDSVNSFERQDVIEFYHKSYVPDNMVVSVAGNVDKEKIKDMVEKYMQPQNKEKAKLSQITPASYTPFTNLVEKDTEQVQICMGVPSISYHDDKRYIQNVMNNILGGGVSSRLFQTMREELGLAYSVYSYPSLYSDTGSYSIYIGTSPAKVSIFFNEFSQEFKKFIYEGVTEEEVQRTQQQIKASIYLGMESVMNRMSRLGKSLIMYGEVIPSEEVIEQILKVDKNDVQQFAGEILKTSLLSLAAIGSGDILPIVENEYHKCIFK